MAILSTTHIHINGNKLPYYNSCSLRQEIGEHHTMELHCLLETIQRFCNANDQEIEDLLGCIVTIETKSYADIDFHGMLKFKGIVTGLNYRKGLYASDGDYVVIKAKSPTIIADDGPHQTSFSDMSFVDIIEQNFSNYDTSKLKINTGNSKLTEPILYTVQANESCFKFAQRMTARNGEWLYYNGEELVFGLDTETDELELILGRDLQDFNTSLTPIPQNFKYYTNDYLTNDVHENESSSSSGISDGAFGLLNNSSKDIYANPTNIWVNISDDVNAKKRLDKNVLLQQNALQSNQIIVSGSSDNPGMQLAAIIKISQNNYRVTKVTHSYSNNGEYENFFEAISTNVDAYPKTNINLFPIAQSQMAKVIENHDPDGLGRIKVQFAWQRPDGLTTPWIRSISPSASQGQGFFFIPEVDDEVLVDFEGGNAECPYSIGGVYNSNATPPDGSSNSSNHMKMLRSRSGCIIALDDNAGSIKLQDAAGSMIFLDGTGNILISAVEQFNIDCKTGFFDATETLNVGSPDTTIAGDSSLWLTSDTELKADGGTATLEAKTGKAELKGVTAEVNASTTAKVNGTAMTEIKGGQVKLN